MSFLFHSSCFSVRIGSMNKSILSVVGKDRAGIIAHICSYLAESNVNILDITQTIVDGFFNMMMICDTSNATKEFNQITEDLDGIGKKLGILIKFQREDIFEQMQRI